MNSRLEDKQSLPSRFPGFKTEEFGPGQFSPCPGKAGWEFGAVLGNCGVEAVVDPVQRQSPMAVPGCGGRVEGVQPGREGGHSTHPKSRAPKGSMKGQDRGVGGEGEHTTLPKLIKTNLIPKIHAGGFNKPRGPCQESHSPHPSAQKLDM